MSEGPARRKLPERRRVSLSLRPREHDAVVTEAERQGITPSRLCRDAALHVVDSLAALRQKEQVSR